MQKRTGAVPAVEGGDPAAMEKGGTRPGPRRLPLLDMLRGLAVLVMMAYHFCWDLTLFGLAGFDLFRDPFWLTARFLILAVFLLISGVSLALALRRGREKAFESRQLLPLALSALLVSAGSAVMFPNAWIFFGVLHFLLVARILSRLFICLPEPVLLGLAALFVCGWFYAPGFAFLDPLMLQWIGLSAHPAASADLVPMVPWLGIFLLGLAAGQRLRLAIIHYPLAVRLAGWQPQAGASALLFRGGGWCGRHALLIYLLHQPVLLGALFLFKAVTG